MALVIAGLFGAIIFLLIKYTVYRRSDSVKWAVFTSPFFFFIAGTICTLSIVYKGSPKFGPALFTHEAPADALKARVPNYNVVQHDDEEDTGELAALSTLLTKNVDIDAIKKSPAGSDKDLAVSDNEKAQH
ncbi:hypothetical protein DL98DRAFT_593493 [Cadophora sp. DSE1049]|nr:hypothetical protein DL98DRAFT_593493 [Cadophora sp. DSE1049]